jgi:hypothetical protein
MRSIWLFTAFRSWRSLVALTKPDLHGIKI